MKRTKNKVIETLPKDHKERYIELIHNFEDIEAYPNLKHCNGFLVNGQYIIAAKKKRWRNKGYGKWYWYKNMDALKTYIYGEDQWDNTYDSEVKDLENRVYDVMYDIEREFEEIDVQLETYKKQINYLKHTCEKLRERVHYLEAKMDPNFIMSRDHKTE